MYDWIRCRSEVPAPQREQKFLAKKKVQARGQLEANYKKLWMARGPFLRPNMPSIFQCILILINWNATKGKWHQVLHESKRSHDICINLQKSKGLWLCRSQVSFNIPWLQQKPHIFSMDPTSSKVALDSIASKHRWVSACHEEQAHPSRKWSRLAKSKKNPTLTRKNICHLIIFLD